MSVIRLKQGETFSIDLQYLESDRVTPKSLAGITIYSVVRDTNFVIHAELDITVTNEAQGLYTASAPLGTSDWPAGMLLWDVNYNNGDVEKTIAIEVLRTESLSNTKIVNIGPSSVPENILAQLNFTIAGPSGPAPEWSENTVHTTGFITQLDSIKHQQRKEISTFKVGLNLSTIVGGIGGEATVFLSSVDFPTVSASIPVIQAFTSIEITLADPLPIDCSVYRLTASLSGGWTDFSIDYVAVK